MAIRTLTTFVKSDKSVVWKIVNLGPVEKNTASSINMVPTSTRKRGGGY